MQNKVDKLYKILINISIHKTIKKIKNSNITTHPIMYKKQNIFQKYNQLPNQLNPPQQAYDLFPRSNLIFHIKQTKNNK